MSGGVNHQKEPLYREDLAYFVIDITNVSKLYLKKINCALVQWRSGSDDVEHKFGMIYEHNPKPTTLDSREIIARHTVVRSSTFNTLC